MSDDEKYLAIISGALAVCKRYKPKFGRGKGSGVTMEEFQAVYKADPFYEWFGLDSPLVYAAHKAAGGITSVYRQIGIGCQKVFHQLLQDSLGQTDAESSWSYTLPSAGGKSRRLSLDGRISLATVKVRERVRVVEEWIGHAKAHVGLTARAATRLHGAVFEVRQGYKSKDSKRQNADIANAANAYAND
jgi:hypothetical protein